MPRSAVFPPCFRRRHGACCLRIQAITQLVADDGHLGWGVNANPNAPLRNLNDGDRDILADPNPLAGFSCQNKHGDTLPAGFTCQSLGGRGPPVRGGQG